MAEINIKSLVLAIVLGFASWLYAFIIVGSTFYDFSTGQQIQNPNFGYYIAMLIVTFIISIIVLGIYLWKYEQKNPIISDKWALDAVVLGAIICGMNFLLDAIFFGVMLQVDLIAYFWLQTTTGYLYPLIILETLILAYLIYGRKEGQK